MIIERFAKHLTAIEYPKEKTSWNIAGILKDRNAFYRFDVRDMSKASDGSFFKKGNTKTKAEKMVFETSKNWIIVDIDELHKYLIKNKIKKINLEEILNKLDWNIIIQNN
jgi:hypothetical protein